ncbi:hypothetical protein GCM10028771_33900 [Nocardioides marmoraquaticus]
MTPVGEVQGTTGTSPLSGQTVTIRGVVVGDHQGASPALGGFYLQDAGDGDRATSDGVFVFNRGGPPVALGDQVTVTGAISEFQGQTQVSGRDTTTVCGTGATVRSTPLRLPLASADALERHEGMLVRLPQRLSVTETFQLGRFGEVRLSSGGRLRQPTDVVAPGADAAALQAANNRNVIRLDDGTNAQNPDPIVFGRGGEPLSATNTLRGGDTVRGATGVMTYTWAGNAASGNAYRLRPVGALGGQARFEATNPRPKHAPKVGGRLQVASANLLNFFDTASGCRFGTTGGPADCRGADDAVELERQVAKEVAALRATDADVVGVMEVENDGYAADSALGYLVDRLNAARGPRWSYVDVDAATGTPDAAGTDAIKSGFLYRTHRVSPVKGRTWADTASPVWERRPVAQTFRDRAGRQLTVVVNHFKSKGSCPAAATDPDADQGDGQSCWNARRTEQAERLATWVRGTVVPAAGDPDVMLLGDFNAYSQEDPVRVLREAGYTDLVRRFQGRSSYSYAFDGQWGSLDHAFASRSLLRQVTGADDHHTNADEPSVLDYNTEFKSAGQVASLYAPDQFRNSDHDALRVGLELTGPRAKKPGRGRG